MTHPAPPRWRKSTRSGSQSDCVEVHGDLDRLQDSKNKGVVLVVGQQGWAAFLTATKNGKLDHN